MTFSTIIFLVKLYKKGMIRVLMQPAFRHDFFDKFLFFSVASSRKNYAMNNKISSTIPSSPCSCPVRPMA